MIIFLFKVVLFLVDLRDFDIHCGIKMHHGFPQSELNQKSKLIQQEPLKN